MPRSREGSPEKKITKAIIDLLVNVPMFDTLTSDELRIVTRHMNFIDLEKGETLFKEGEKGDYVCFVVSGHLDVLKGAGGGNYVVLATLSKGRSIGEMAVIDNFPRSATVKAREKSTLVILTRKGFDMILSQHPPVGVKILKGIARLLSQNLRMTSSRLVDHLLPLS
ncbi:MAG: cyclic nucleotide-binding domain-containing protein [Deltaproteobacteria bacterium]|nr:cyclic nucleotide-binding domain-containing protein [Deltaproteobacteria bacterium]MBW2017107.1 cyclic nucleotide-binding domain-containing protein [Deltaproteobacteria bacterium]MBW2129871.1 cyclic nucleotide-binding domain-containing protein [Deltaproteobacteria bacterium]MBW2303108.1 cyclic nucleotide-binding domain-containing protein [Deltaproteobacteria bacterium]